ncbi:diguanylate cyclase [Pseudomonas sp. CFBP 5748]|nr:diguanylate cyclase [uncultured Pseudomonas sp.]
MVRDNSSAVAHKHSLTTRALRLAVLRIGLVSLGAGAISYHVNSSSIEREVTGQLLLSTEQSLQRESLPFREIKDLQQNFLREFKETLARPGMQTTLINDFRQIFYRHEDGSYTQRPQLFEGEPLADGRRFAGMSATYSPDIAPDGNTQARFALSYLLSHKYGSSTKGRLFNFYGVVPEKGFPIYQDADIAKVFTYSGPDALKLETYEFYARGFGTPTNDTLFTRMYWDYSNNAWMTTIATADVADASGKHSILAAVDVLLDELMKRIAKPAMKGAYSSLFIADGAGTLIYHPAAMEEVKSSAGEASIRSLKMAQDYPLLDAIADLTPGQARIVQTPDNIVAMGFIPETPWVLAVHYPRTLMIPAIFDNLLIVIVLGLLTLLVEIFILRSILQKQVALPLARLIQATRQLGIGKERLRPQQLPTQSPDEIGELARAFANMAERVQDAQEHLELKVQDRTAELEKANRQLYELSNTDGLTGVANRRRFDEALVSEWRRGLRADTVLSLMLIDVDHFKKYNDHYGHQAGDDCLRSVARTLTDHAQRAGDLVARYGGEEFVLITTTANTEKALEHARAVCLAMESMALPHATSPLGMVTVSIGLAVMPFTKDGAVADLLKQADQALYNAKDQGRNRAVLADVH